MTKQKKIEVRVTDEEKFAIQVAAQAKGVTVSKWIREIALRAVKKAQKAIATVKV